MSHIFIPISMYEFVVFIYLMLYCVSICYYIVDIVILKTIVYKFYKRFFLLRLFQHVFFWSSYCKMFFFFWLIYSCSYLLIYSVNIRILAA